MKTTNATRLKPPWVQSIFGKSVSTQNVTCFIVSSRWWWCRYCSIFKKQFVTRSSTVALWSCHRCKLDCSCTSVLLSLPFCLEIDENLNELRPKENNTSIMYALWQYMEHIFTLILKPGRKRARVEKSLPLVWSETLMRSRYLPLFSPQSNARACAKA